MTKFKLFIVFKKEVLLEDVINAWLEDHPDIEIISHQLAIGSNKYVQVPIVTIFYKEKEN